MPPLSTLDMHARTRLLIGDAGLARLAAARVAVIGLGGVGSAAAEQLCRAGVGHLTLVDFDTIRPSNLNRQLLALHSTLGRPKVEMAAARLADIDPECAVDARQTFFATDTADALDLPAHDWVLDCIDSLGPKVQLIYHCVSRGVPVITSAGAAAKTDPSGVAVRDLFETRNCPLARHLRRRLRKPGHRGRSAGGALPGAAPEGYGKGARRGPVQPWPPAHPPGQHQLLAGALRLRHGRARGAAPAGNSTLLNPCETPSPAARTVSPLVDSEGKSRPGSQTSQWPPTARKCCAAVGPGGCYKGSYRSPLRVFPMTRDPLRARIYLRIDELPTLPAVVLRVLGLVESEAQRPANVAQLRVADALAQQVGVGNSGDPVHFWPSEYLFRVTYGWIR